MSSGVCKFYREGEKATFTIYYSEDLAIRSPIFMNIPEPAVEMLVRPLSTYSVYMGVTDIGKRPWYWDPSVIQNPLIAIIGMPGAGKSLPPSEKVLVIRDGKPMIVSIKDVKIGDKVFAIDRDLRVRLSDVINVMKFHHKGKLLRITLRSGRTVVATPDHSFVVIRDGKLIPIKGSDLKKGDMIPTLRYKLPTLVTFITVGKRYIKLTYELGFFIGLYLAEGDINKVYVRIHNTDPIIREDLKRAIKGLGFEYREYEKCICVYAPDEVRTWIEEEFGVGAEHKKVPAWVLVAPEEFRKGLLAGYFAGDGALYKRSDGKGIVIEATTKSSELATGIQQVLASLGIGAYLRPKKVGNAVYWRIIVFDKKEFLEVIPVRKSNLDKEELQKHTNENHQIAERVSVSIDAMRRLIDKYVKPYKDEVEKGLFNYYLAKARRSIDKALTREGLANFLEKIRTKAEEKGVVNKLLQDPDYLELQKVLESPVLHDEIVSIEEVDYEGYVYDIETAENTFMTANGVFVHNSETVKTLIIRMKEKGIDIPVIIVDPEGEYHVIVKQLGEGVVLNIGTEHYVNIFDRPRWDFNYQLWVRKAVIPGILKALRVTPRQAPLMMRVLEKAIFDVYEKIYRFDPVNKETWKKPDPTLLDVVRYLEGEVKPYLEGRVKRQPPLFRTIMALLERLRRWVEGQGTDFFAYRSTIQLADLLKQPLVVFNIKALPEDARDMFTYYIFSYFYALMEMLPPLPTFGLRILLVFDEGWILLKHEKGQESPLAPLFRRARKYGFAAIIATQQYKDVSADILPLVGTVILLRIRDAEAVKKLKETLKIPDRIADMIPNLPTGKAVVSIAWKRTDFQNSNVPFLVNIETAVKPVLTMVFYKRVGPEEVFRALKAQMARSSE